MKVQFSHSQTQHLQKQRTAKSFQRLGSALVEMAVVMPVFGLLMAGLAEFGHTYLVLNTMRSGTKQAARYGVGENVSTADVVAKMKDILGSAINTQAATILVKDGSAFDAHPVDASTIKISDLPDIEVKNADPRQLFIVRVEVPYNSVALLPPFWIKNVTLSAQAVVRHE